MEGVEVTLRDPNIDILKDKENRNNLIKACVEKQKMMKSFCGKAKDDEIK